MHMHMHMHRGRLCALGVLLCVYLAGVLLLSSLSLEHREAYVKGAQGLQGGGRGRGRQASGTGVGVGVGGAGAETAGSVRGRTSSSRRSRLHWCRGLHFLEKPGPVVALASFPGSGNTWLRYLLQQATGVYTGSVYKDYGLLKNGFPAESVVNGSVSVVKTHEWGPAARKPFHKAVLLVRAPGAAIQAEFNRQSGGHIGFASPDRYRRNKGRYWQQFVSDKLSSWRNTNLDWLHNFSGPTHVVLYEELVQDVAPPLRLLLRFLGLRVSESQLTCALERREGIYRRKRRLVAFDPYTTAMKAALEEQQQLVYAAITRHQQRQQPPAR